MKWRQLEADNVLRELNTHLAGLGEADAASRLRQHGPNELVGTGVRSPWRIVWEQLTELMVVILIIAAVLSAILGDYKDAIAIGAIARVLIS